jgi:myo-inositol-1-phosphate synthase
LKHVIPLASSPAVVATFDIDVRKVGKDITEVIFEAPNCTAIFCRDLTKAGVRVRMGRILDGGVEVLLNYLKSV